jgi:aminobenzoyl-glutamate utilization protein A
VKNRLVISKNYHSVKQFTYFNDDRKRYGHTGAVHPDINPAAERVASRFSPFCGIRLGRVSYRSESRGNLDSLGYELAMGRDVVDAESRMGLPDDATLAREFARARAQGAPEKWLAPFEGGFTGIVATLNTGRPGPTLAFRVDMDALDLSEALDDSHRPFRDGFASCNPGMMHACAHDGHTTIGLGLAQVLKQNEARLNGTIKLIFQPAEEGTRGARAMVAAGALDGVDYLLPSILVPAFLPVR